MDSETFEQVGVEEDIFGEQAVYLSEGLGVVLNFHDGSAITGG
jgi:translation elongation factor P/translation initiation factor 5A